jgi:hypothetical protein
MHVNRRRRRRVLGIALVAFLFVAAPAAYAVSVVIDDTDLTGGGGTTWDPASNTYACTPPSTPPSGFIPVHDGATATRSDAFDDAFAIWVGGLNGKIFRDPDGNGNKRGQRLSVGPTNTKGFRVSQTETALQTSPTLRMIYQFKNTTGHTIRRAIALESNLGSDGDTTIDASSSGNQSWSRSDRWLVTHQDPFTATSDPVVSQVWFGKQAAKRPVAIEHTSLNSPDCFLTTFNLGVKPHHVRDLMFFGEMNNSIGGAVQKAHKFNRRHLNDKLLKGLGNRVLGRIVNWDL